MTKGELIGELKKFSMKAITEHEGPLILESLERATYYTANRINDGIVRDVSEMKNVWAAFMDGFCTAKGHW